MHSPSPQSRCCWRAVSRRLRHVRQRVSPHRPNARRRLSRPVLLLQRAELVAPQIADLLTLDDAAFRQLFSGSPIKRIGRDRFVRNVLIAAGNSTDAGLIAQIEVLLADPAPVVRGAAIWALGRLSPEVFAQRRQDLFAAEQDASVLAEWGRRI
jgi:hypothetical protein